MSSECEGLCIVVKPDLSKISPVISSNAGLHREPTEFSKCRLSSSNGHGSYLCPPDAGIVAQCSNYSFEEGYWEYNDGKIQPALDRALQYGTVTN